jgi:hypothetical protein
MSNNRYIEQIVESLPFQILLLNNNNNNNNNNQIRKYYLKSKKKMIKLNLKEVLVVPL